MSERNIKIQNITF